MMMAWGLSVAANQKTLIFLLDAAQDLPKLRAGSQGGNDISRRGRPFFEDKAPPSRTD